MRGARVEKASAAVCANQGAALVMGLPKLDKVPRSRRRDAARHVAALALCLGAAMTFGVAVLAQNVPATTMKDLQQDGEIYDLQASRTTMQQEIQALVAVEDKQAQEQSHDEGIATGAFIVLGLLQGIGLLKDINPANWRRERDENE